MDLKELRDEIDRVDDEMAVLFERRAKLACDVAEYKREHGMEILQTGREREVLEKTQKKVSDDLKNASNLFFTTLMDISKCRQQQLLTRSVPFTSFPEIEDPVIGAVTKGSYTADACEKFCCEGCRIEYFSDFAEVFRAVENGDIDYGALPIENSTAGEVNTTLQLMIKHDFFIVKSTKIRINHVLAGKKGAKLSDIKVAMSHEMALKQCSGFIEKKRLAVSEESSTARAAELVAQSDDKSIAAICSASCAKLFGLQILAEDICDIGDNYTRFIMISKNLQVSERSNIVSLCLTVPHTAGSLYRLLTRFAYCGLNLCRIESRPVPGNLAYLKDDAFDFIFYLDFIGSIKDENVIKLLIGLEKEMRFYRFFGNYEELA